jgi:hypothetical protein
MIAFEVTINGKAICTAGVGEFGYTATDVLWDKRNPAHRPKGARKKQWEDELLYLRVSGLVAHDERLRERLDWSSKSLSAGDRIVIRIVERANCDEPKKRVCYDKSEKAAMTCSPMGMRRRGNRRTRK